MGRRLGYKQPSKEQLTKMRDAGMGTTSIGKALDMDAASVRYYLKKYGLPTRLETVHISDSLIDDAIAAFQKGRQGKRSWRQH